MKLVDLCLLHSELVLPLSNLVNLWQRRDPLSQQHQRKFQLITLPLTLCEGSFDVLFFKRAHHPVVELERVLKPVVVLGAKVFVRLAHLLEGFELVSDHIDHLLRFRIATLDPGDQLVF